MTDDWKASLQLYLVVINYFFSPVGVAIPDEDELAVRNPILGIHGGPPKIKKMMRSSRSAGAGNTVYGSGSAVSA